jgi:metallophosphoesterase (TIGR00282 family)
MRILAVGDIVGKAGIQKLKDCLPKIIEDNMIDFVIVNGENAADGMGLTEKQYRDILSLNVNVVTMGNHTWGKKEIFNYINENQIIRPANYSPNNPGHGYGIFECKGKKICVINLIGRTGMAVLTDNPFLKAKEIINEVKDKVDIIIVDFHAEATAEKLALAYYLDGRVNVVFGTHTHVQSADERILDKGIGYITDIGMTGPYDSVIGMDKEAALKRFLTSIPERYKLATGNCMFNGVVFDIDDNTGKVVNVYRINERD